MPVINIKKIAVHKIDITKHKVKKRIDIQSDSNFTEYVNELLEDMYKENSRHKLFQFESETTEVASLVQKTNETNWKKRTRSMAERLHRSEVNKQDELGNFQTLKRGALVQLFLDIDDQKTIIFTKVDLDSYLDERKLKKKSGLPIKKRTQKTAIVSFNNDDTFHSINVSDSNNTISEYWWKDFLEARELNSSESNTVNAFGAIDKVLQKKLKEDYKFDYWTLRNAVLSYFRTSESFTLDNMLDLVFDEYVPDNPDLSIDDLKEEIAILPNKAKGGFDTQFEITHKSIKAKMINKKIPLAKNLELGITGDLNDIKKLIDTGKSDNGRKFIKIFSDNGFEEFQRYMENNQ